MEIKKHGKIVAITGPSGAGRGAVVAMLQKDNSIFVEPTGVTTRMPRPGEVEGKHCFFVTEEQFKEGIENNSFLFWSQHALNFYGIYKDTVSQLIDEGKNVILEIALGEDINTVKKFYPDLISIYIIPPNADSMIRRLIAREHNDMDRVQGRINVYEAEAYAALKTDAILVNEYPEDTAATIVNIIDDPAVQKKYYDECVELVVELKKALKEYKAGSRFIIKDGCLQKYKEKPGGLYTVEIPEGITSIGAGAFRWCEYLSEARIPQSVIDIGSGAFQGCECLKFIQIPRNVKHIGEEAFMGCGLNNIRIPRGIETIADGVFRDCSELTRVQIPDSVTTIGEEAFSHCSSLSEISLPENIDQIGRYAFSSCKSITTFAIPGKLPFIPAGMFFKCYNLYDIHIPNTIEEIGDQAFDTCRRLTNVVIPAATVRIGAWSFAGCTELRNVTFVNEETEIDVHAFENCTSISHINLPGKASEIREGTFEGCTSLENVVFPMHIKTIGKNAFKGCYQLKHVVIPAGVTTIKQGAFAECRGLRCIEIPESVFSIEDHAFDGCYALKIRAVPGSVAERYAKENRIDIEYVSTVADDETLKEYWDRRLDRIESNQKNHQRITQETQRIVIGIDKKQDELLGFVNFFKEDLQDWLKQEKSRLDASTLLQDPEQVEVATAASVLKSSNYINQQVSSVTELIEDATKHLRSVFGPTWNDLLPDTQTSLISAGVLWESCAGIEDDQNFDYSGICIATTSALEGVLKHFFYTGFQQFMIEKYQNPSDIPIENIYSDWPEALLDTKYHVYRKILDEGGTPEVNIGTDFTMGTLPHLFHSKKSVIVRRRMNEYLCTILKPIICASNKGWAINALDFMTNLKDGVRDSNSFVSRCEHIRNVYRNPAAHSGIVVRKTAEACTDAIVGRVEAFKHNMEVQGLLMELYSMLK